MFGDAENDLSVAQAFTGAATVSTNSFDKQSADRRLSIGRAMAIKVQVTTAAGAGSTHTMEAIQADDDALTSNVEVLASVSKLAATLVKGHVFAIPLPPGSDTKRYLGFRNTSTGGTTTVSLDAALVPLDEIPKNASFPKTNNASV